MKSIKWVAAGTLAVAVAGGAAWWAGRDTAPEQRYRTAAIERGTVKAVVAASGTVNPVSQVQVSSQVSGQIRELLVDFNSEVKQGQLIARLDPQTFEYRLRQSEADVDAARASVLTAQATVQQALAQVSRAQVELQEAERDLERKRELMRQAFISSAEVDTAVSRVATLAEALKAVQAQVAVARAQATNAQAIVRQREASLSQAQVDLQRTQIRSPVNGVVIKRSVEVGQTVAASLQAPELFVIARNLSDMQVDTSIDEADVSRVKPGQPVDFTIDAFPGRAFEGRVRQIRKSSVLQQNVVTYVAVVDFDNPDALLLPGMTANVRIVTDTREAALRLPNAALRVRLPGTEAAGAPPQRTTAGPPDGPLARPTAGAGAAAGTSGPGSGSGAAARGEGPGTPGRLYTLGADGRPVAHAVRLGISDGTMTELLPSNGPAGGASPLAEGTAVIVGVEGSARAGGRPGAPAGPPPRLGF